MKQNLNKILKSGRLDKVIKITFGKKKKKNVRKENKV